MDLSKLGSSGGLTVDYINPSIIVPAGVTGDIITVTPPLGKKAVILFLASSGSNQQSGISVEIEGVEVVPPSFLIQATNTALGPGVFAVGNCQGVSSVGYITTEDPDQVIKVKKDAGNTAHAITYVYGYGV